ncbi:hypothetical protein FQA47_020236 [Oryzias melastigma]|uniref:Uncharacterized protein n=1 Tax=Oryzias melastigma TaxID=30732 RepID=A0A834F1M8_ORYME|nr:hypothetical protein FQA47_020236 [Oryzias melastigma]
MSSFLCCCCLNDNSSSERQPLLNSKEGDGAGTARPPRPGQDVAYLKQSGSLQMRRVNVPELDQRFADLAQTFNQHQERYERMVKGIRNLQKEYDCTRCDHMSLSECVGKIMQEWETKYKVTLKMKGYDFTLNVVPVSLEGETEEEPLPPALQHAQNEVRYISDRAKVTISKSTTLQELTGWLLRSQSKMIEQVHGAAENYQEQGRLKENLEENMREVRRAQEFIQEYKQQAGEVLKEAAQIAEAQL